MNKKTIKEVAWIGDEYVKGKITGVALSFHGLGGGAKDGISTVELEWAKAGGLVVFPYYGPWSWMNRAARAFVDELVDSVYDRYKIGPKAPLISTGGSMGGHASLLYTRYAKRPVAACLAVFPVCDLKYHFYERLDLPKTIRHAFVGYKEKMADLFVEHSPVCQVEQMPRIPYLITHGDKDTAVSKKHHSDPMVARMRKRRMNVEYIEVPGMGHGSAVPLHVMTRQVDFVTSVLRRKKR